MVAGSTVPREQLRLAGNEGNSSLYEPPSTGRSATDEMTSVFPPYRTRSSAQGISQ